MLILIMEVVLGVDTADGVASSFMSDAVFFIMGSYFLKINSCSLLRMQTKNVED